MGQYMREVQFSAGLGVSCRWNWLQIEVCFFRKYKAHGAVTVYVGGSLQLRLQDSCVWPASVAVGLDVPGLTLDGLCIGFTVCADHIRTCIAWVYWLSSGLPKAPFP